MELLAVSGSLRAESSNSELLRAFALVAAPANVTFFTGLNDLPHFNPDLDAPHAVLPEAVRQWRWQVSRADALIVSSPEYAHGVPGTLKNALDWLVSGSEIVHHPVALLNPSPRSEFAQAQLAETLRTMSASVVEGAVIAVPVQRGMSASQIADDPHLRASLRQAFEAVSAAVPRSRDKRRWFAGSP